MPENLTISAEVPQQQRVGCDTEIGFHVYITALVAILGVEPKGFNSVNGAPL
jgi:hypothetical protein